MRVGGAGSIVGFCQMDKHVWSKSLTEANLLAGRALQSRRMGGWWLMRHLQGPVMRPGLPVNAGRTRLGTASAVIATVRSSTEIPGVG